jgi:hypothetical protein
MRKHNRTVSNVGVPLRAGTPVRRPRPARTAVRRTTPPRSARFYLKAIYARRGTLAHRCTPACARIGERRGGWRDCDTHARKKMLWPLTYPVMLNRVRPRVPPEYPLGYPKATLHGPWTL